MNDHPTPIDDVAGQQPGQGAPRSAGRRRFVAKGAAPVLLGSLISKPVLGAQYICTVSGHTSGNASAHQIQGVDCSAGETLTYWKDIAAWPTAVGLKGGFPDGSCNFNTSNPKGVVFNGFMGLAPTFYLASSGGVCSVVTASSSVTATMLQVLVSTSTDEVFRLGRAVVVSLLNAAQLGTAYPVQASRVVEMFNAVKSGGSYHISSVNLNLTRLGVIEYLEKLYAPAG